MRRVRSDTSVILEEMDCCLDRGGSVMEMFMFQAVMVARYYFHYACRGLLCTLCRSSTETRP